MQIRSPRSVIAISAVVALSVAALAPTAALAKGPGPGAGSCDGQCTSEQPQSQQLRVRAGSGGGSQTRANAGGGQQVRARNGSAASTNNSKAQVRATTGQPKRARVQDQARPNVKANRAQGVGAQRNRPDDRPRGPEACEECRLETGEQLAMGELTETQVGELVYMANEEKLAHDVYTALADLYDLPVFANIAAAEAQHQAAIDAILERYGIEDETSALPAGVFSDADIAASYAQLLEQGSESLAAALEVGVFIEQDDIAALEGVMAQLERSAPDVHAMYANLQQASQRHLEAFDREG